MARPIWLALSAVPLSVTSPFLASTSIIEVATWLSAWSLPFTIVVITASSLAPVGAPTTLSFVRTIVTERSRSLWISVGERRHSVMRVVTSAVLAAPVVADAMSAELRLVVLVAPVLVSLDGVVLVEDEGEVLELLEDEGVVEATEPLALEVEELGVVVLLLGVVLVEVSREVSDATLEPLPGAVVEVVEPLPLTELNEPEELVEDELGVVDAAELLGLVEEVLLLGVVEVLLLGEVLATLESAERELVAVSAEVEELGEVLLVDAELGLELLGEELAVEPRLELLELEG